MKRFLPFLPLLLLFACGNNTKQNELPLFNGFNLSLRPGEQIKEVNKAIKDDYFSYFAKQPQNLPLFRYIDEGSYRIFVGLPVNTNIRRQLSAPLAGNDSSLVQSESDSLTYIYRQYTINGAYITEYTAGSDKSMVYLLCVTSSKPASDSLFTRQKLAGRINFDK